MTVTLISTTRWDYKMAMYV